jgi:hypothetical protein
VSAERVVVAAAVLAVVGAVTFPLDRHDVSATAARPADDPGLEVSVDGRHWGDQLTRPLFDPHTVWVPGEVRTRAFWVRARRGDAAALVVTVRSGRADEPPPVRLAARTGRGEWATSEDPGRVELVGDRVVAPGVPQRVEVRASVEEGSTGREVEPVPVAVDVSLLTTEPLPVDRAGGWSRLRAVVVAGGGALGALLTVLAGRRRRRGALDG